jgi:hypothetical protein
LGVVRNSTAAPRARAAALEITDALIDLTSGFIRQTGATRRAAARMARVSENTFKGWLREAGDLKDDNDPRRRLLFAIETAEGEAEYALTEAYWAGASVDPQVAQRFLERRFSRGDEKWARTEHLTVSDGDAAPMEMVDARKLLSEKLTKLLGPRAGSGSPGRNVGGVDAGDAPVAAPGATCGTPEGTP